MTGVTCGLIFPCSRRECVKGTQVILHGVISPDSGLLRDFDQMHADVTPTMKYPHILHGVVSQFEALARQIEREDLNPQLHTPNSKP